MNRSGVRDMTQGSPMKLVASFAAPLLFGFLLQQLYSFADTAIVGRLLGADALAAVGATGSLNFMVLGFCMGLCAGFAIPVAQSFGAGDYTDLRRYVFHSAYLCVIFSLILAGVTAALCTVFLKLMNTPEDILQDSVIYIRTIFIGIPATVLYNMSSGILRSLGDSKTPVLFLALAAVLNIALDLFCILYLKMGVFGAALATVVSQAISGLACVYVMIRRFDILRPRDGEMAFSGKHAGKLILMGVPMGLQYSVTAIGSLIVQTAVNGLGTAAVAAVAAALKPIQLFACVYDTLASTMATFAGQNAGAGKPERITAGLKAAALIGIAYSAVSLVINCFFADFIVSAFVSAENVQVISYAAQYLRTNVCFHVLLLFVNIVRFTIQGMGYTGLAVLAGVSEMAARSLVGLLIVPVWGFTGACFSDPVAWIFADCFLFPCYIAVQRKMRRRLKHDDCPENDLPAGRKEI